MRSIKEWIRDFVEKFKEAPFTQVEPIIVDRIALLNETDNLKIMREIVSNVLNDCVRYDLCSSFAATALDTLLKIIETEINYEKIG